jgi:pyruvate/2-oxoglutarate dehydrogenase complex dihydrolipoamide acyltransferase (E2) component
VAVAFDHRVLDGMTAAGFSSALRARLEAGG